MSVDPATVEHAGRISGNGGRAPRRCAVERRAMLGVVAQLGVGRARSAGRRAGAGGEGAGLEAAPHPGLELGQLGQRRRARTYHVPVVWPGTMLGASPPWVTMPWTRSRGRMCWRSRPIADLGDGEGVGGVDAELGTGRRVRRPCRGSGRRRGRRRGSGTRRSPSGRGCTIIASVDAVEGAPLEHQDLAAAALLGRRAEHLHGDAERRRRPARGRARRRRRRRRSRCARRRARCRAGRRTRRRRRRQRSPDPYSATKAVGRSATPSVDVESRRRRAGRRSTPRPAPPRTRARDGSRCGGRAPRARQRPRPRPVVPPTSPFPRRPSSPPSRRSPE